MNKDAFQNLPVLRPSRRQLMRWSAAGLLGGAGLLALPGSGRAQGGLRPVKLIHAAPVTLPLWSVTYLAEDMGFYKEEGLSVERLGLNSGPTAMTALLAGEGTSSVSTPGEMLAATVKGQPVRAIMSLSSFTAYTLLVSKKFAEARKVAGSSPLAERVGAIRASKGAMRFGITAPGSLTDVLTRLAVKQAGLDPARDVTILPFQSIGNGLAALSNNAIDGFMSPSPSTEQGMAEFGAVPLLRIAAGDLPAGARLQGQVLEARPADLQANRDLYAALVRANLRAMRMIVEAPDAARDALRRSRFSAVKEELWPMVWQNELPTFKSPFVTRDSLQAWIETGLIGGNPDPAKFAYDEVIEMSLVKEGLAKLGWTPPQGG